MNRFLLLVLLPVLALNLGVAGPVTPSQKLCQGVAPKNSMWIAEKDLHVSSITNLQFDTILDRIVSLYHDEIQSKGGNLVIDRRWQDGTVNAYATRDGSDWTLHMYGGLARHPKLTPDGFALVACHELGHHLGGYPKYGADTNPWASYEGAADYYGTLKCMRRYFEPDDNGKILSGMTLDPLTVKLCALEHGSKLEQQLCIRAAMAGVSLANVLAALSADVTPRLNTPDPRQVQVTDTLHPPAQCRLDTYFNGALCRVPVVQELSDYSYRPGSCDTPATYARGTRPACWFAP